DFGELRGAVALAAARVEHGPSGAVGAREVIRGEMPGEVGAEVRVVARQALAGERGALRLAGRHALPARDRRGPELPLGLSREVPDGRVAARERGGDRVGGARVADLAERPEGGNLGRVTVAAGERDQRLDERVVAPDARSPRRRLTGLGVPVRQAADETPAALLRRPARDLEEQARHVILHDL